MRRFTPVALTVAVLAGACGQAIAVNDPNLPKPTNDLLAVYPGARALQEQGRVRMIYGMPMGGGITPQASATSWLELNAEAFGCGALQLSQEWSTPVMDGKFTVFGYKQFIDGYPVELGIARVLVLNGPANQVVYAAGNLAPRPEKGLAKPILTADMARQVAQGAKEAAGMKTWHDPSLVVFQGNGDWIAPVLTWKVTGEGALDNVKTFFVDAATGQSVFVRNEISTIDVNGTVQGWASAGLYPPDATYADAALSLQAIPELKAGITGGNTAYADRTGAFTITNSGSSAVTVTSGTNAQTDIRGGRWVDVRPADGAARQLASQSVIPPGPATLTLNTGGSANPAGNAGIATLTAQVNAAIQIDATHNYFKDRAPAFTALDIVIPANTGVAGTCNAFFNGSSVNFYDAGGGCANTAYTSVMSHEYGHFVVQSLGLAQNSFGEGYGDTNASMVWNDGICGRGFYGTESTNVRDPVAANIQYPCSGSCGGEIHCCGQQIGAIWWQIRTAYGSVLGEPAGLTLTRSEEVAWSLITTGGPDAGDSAGPSTAIQVLTVDDDDGNLGNGTPHNSQICAAFTSHSITCPSVQYLAFQYPTGRPTYLTPNQPTSIPVTVTGANGGTPQPGTGTLTYRVGTSGNFTTVSMAQGAPNQYTATLPATACSNTIQYYVSAQATNNAVQSDPSTAPGSLYSAVAAGTGCPPPPTISCGTIPGTWTELSGAAGAVTITGAAGDDSVAAFTSSVTNSIVTTAALNVCSNGFISVPAINTYTNTPVPNSSVTLGLWVDWDDLFNDSPGSIIHKAANENGVNVEIVEWYQARTYFNSGASGRGSFEVKIFAAPGGPGGALVQYLYQNMAFDWNGNSSTVGFQTSATNGMAVSGLNGNSTDGGTGPLANNSVCTIYVPSLVCYANCDASTSPPVLNVNDFTCFLQKFALGDPYANCDGSTTNPTLNVSDFTCFLQKFAAGCP